MSPQRIDVHHHLLTPGYVAALKGVGIVESGGIPLPPWRPEDSLAMLDRAGIQVALLSLSTPGLFFKSPAQERALARAINEFAAQCGQRWPDRFAFFATLPLPDVDAALAEISYALDILHADGISLYTNYEGIYLGDERFTPIFAELNRRRSVIHIHPSVFTGATIPAAKNAGSTISTLPSFMLEFVFDTTRAVANLVISGALKQFTDVKILLSHAGGTVPYIAHKIVSGALVAMLGGQVSASAPGIPPEQADAFRSMFTDDILSQLRGLYYDTALSANVNAFSSLQQLVPTSQILLGTDYPFAPEIESGTTVRRLERLASLSDSDRQAITTDNALALFPRLQRI
ncbi:MAG TPA: amidohydrolase family protein [Ktedonobacterales bacterium]